jgi:Ca-activated chloride channel family protein
MRPMTNAQGVLEASCTGGRLVDTTGRLLPLRNCSIDIDAHAGLARVVLRQTFVNDSSDPLQATYQFPLPADAAVGDYSFTMNGRRVFGQIDRVADARRRFEAAILEGRTAGLVEQNRSSLFTQEIGNIPPHGEVSCEIEIDQKLKWLEDGHWEWRFPTTIAPRYMGQPGRVPDQKNVSVEVTRGTSRARFNLRLRIHDEQRACAAFSPTHRLATNPEGLVVLESREGEPLDRDIAVRWAAAEQHVGLSVATARMGPEHPLAESAFGLVTLVPPSLDESLATLPRDLILLVDTSGSMDGRPLKVAKAVALALIASMGPADRLEMIAFANNPCRWHAKPRVCDGATKAKASRWVRSLRAEGGTEMHAGLMEALADLRSDAQRQVVLITDGLVGFESEIVRAVRQRTPANCRVHTVGIGPASNRSLTCAVAEAGGGAEYSVDLDEDLAAAAGRIVTRLSKPLVVDVQVSGTALWEAAGPAKCDVLAASPAMIPIRLRPEGGSLEVRGRTPIGTWTAQTDIKPIRHGSGNASVVRLFGRALVERLELDAAAGENVDARIEHVGLQYRIATRLTSWVAVSEDLTVDPTSPVRRERIAQQLPYGLSVEGLGLGDQFEVPRGRPVPEIGSLASPEGLGDQFGVPKGRAAKVARYYQMADNDEVHGNPSQAAVPPPPEVWFERAPDLDHHPDHEAFTPPETDVLFAKVVSRQGERLVLEFEVPRALDWDPAEVITASGLSVRFDPTSTTRPGRYMVGQSIRLVLLGIPEHVEVTSLQRLAVRSTLGNHLVLLIAP